VSATFVGGNISLLQRTEIRLGYGIAGTTMSKEHDEANGADQKE
jgi:hypothetical protein